MIEASAVFCDALGVTVPLDEWESLPGDLTDSLNGAGLQLQHRDDRSELWATPGDTGVVRLQRQARAGVVSLYASGIALAALRQARVYASFLHVLASRPHRVTRLDASADVACDAPPVIADVLAKGRCGTVALTRKTVRPEDVDHWSKLRPDGRESGTVYLGSASAEVRAAVYDKRLERYAKTSAEWDDLPERVRYELRVRNGLPTLGDAYLPASLFFQHMSPSLVPQPAELPQRYDGFGFEIDRPEPALPASRLKSRTETSADLGAICVLAARDGAGGLPFLLSLVRARYEREVARLAPSGVKGPPAPSETSYAPPEAAGVVVPLRPLSEPVGQTAPR